MYKHACNVALPPPPFVPCCCCWCSQFNGTNSSVLEGGVWYDALGAPGQGACNCCGGYHSGLGHSRHTCVNISACEKYNNTYFAWHNSGNRIVSLFHGQYSVGISSCFHSILLCLLFVLITFGCICILTCVNTLSVGRHCRKDYSSGSRKLCTARAGAFAAEEP